MVQARDTAAGEERVTPLELFFDLIFVFAITQVTAVISDDPTWAGLVKGLLVLSVLWWAWAAYAWLTNTINPDEGVVRLVMFGAMAAMLIASLAVPDAFGDDALLFAWAYALVRIAHLVLYAVAGRGDRDLLAAIARLAIGSAVGIALLFVAAGLDGRAQVTVWIVAVVVDLAGALIGGGRGWRLSPGHFAERHALIVIIALGESIVAVGVGATDVLTAGVVTAAVLGLAVAAALWWLYFDVVAIVAERRLHERTGTDRLTMARDSYSYLHLPMVAGIILVAVAMKKTLAHVDEPLELVPAVTLCGGVALYLVAHILFRLRNVGSLNRQRLVVAALLLAFLPVAVELPALATLAAVGGLLAALIAYEAIHFAAARRPGPASGGGLHVARIDPDLPDELRDATDELVARVGRGRVEAAAERLSGAYRERGAAAAKAARTEADVAAYVAYRAPATYAAMVFVLAHLAEQRPGWCPDTLLDVGAGPGVASLAAAAVWPALERITLVEAEPEMIRAGRALAAVARASAVRDATWVQADAAAADAHADLVLVSYVLNELSPDGVAPLVSKLWEQTEDTIVLVEPGTPDAYRLVLAAREVVLGAGGFTVAPCPHDEPCPLPQGDWCHFSVRLSRGEAHRAAKSVARGFEDEKLSYAALAREPQRRATSRVIRRPVLRSGHVYLDLCEQDGLRRAIVTRREKEKYRRARKAAWGDAFE